MAWVMSVYAGEIGDLFFESGEVEVEYLGARNATVRGSGVLRLTGTEPFDGGRIVLEGDASTVIFEGLTCTEVRDRYLGSIFIGDRAFDETKDRLSIYGNGCEVIPEGWLLPLIVYNGEKCTGDTMHIARDIYYRGRKLAPRDSHLPQILLGDFNNNIRSFRLKRGFRATFANNDNGTGYSRVFTATDSDIVVESMPEGLEFASFIRVSRADRIGKRGICGLDEVALTRSSWYYSWGASDESAPDYEFVPMRHNMWWDGWDKIDSRVNTADLLGYNEPDHADQSDLSPDYAILNWNDFMHSGLRVGSPAPDAIEKDWLKRFLATADSLNYRVDFVATHMYWNNQDSGWLTGNISRLCRDVYGGRPMWITEWNNGANWTNEYWPDAKGTRLDADFKVILDENGKQTTVDRPHTPANSEVQVKWLCAMLQAFDDCEWLERHSFYNWVQDARAVELAGKLTPAGKVFALFRSRPGFNRDTEYIHTWHIAPPFPQLKSYTNYCTLSFYDHNGETGVNYTVERRIDNGPWETYRVLERDVDYQVGKSHKIVIYYDVNGRYSFRVKARSYKGDESCWSRVVSCDVTAGAKAPAAAQLRVAVRDGVLCITSPARRECDVVAADGRVVRRIALEAGQEGTVDGLPQGVYIVSGVKVLI